jgi:hypothetical protein
VAIRGVVGIEDAPPGSQPLEIAAFLQANQQAIDAEVAIETALAELHAQACADLPHGTRSALLAIRVNRGSWPSLPAAHLVVDRSEPEWLALREALATARIAVVRIDPGHGSIRDMHSWDRHGTRGSIREAPSGTRIRGSAASCWPQGGVVPQAEPGEARSWRGELATCEAICDYSRRPFRRW